MKIYLGLLHHPIRNKWGEIITTSVTNLDLHDIARSCCSYGVVEYLIITPLKAQHELLNRLLQHWQREENVAYNPDRAQALGKVLLLHSLHQAREHIVRKEGALPLMAVTGANLDPYDGGERELRERLFLDNKTLFILFGTGHGLADEVVRVADFRLRPIVGRGEDGYNHLSVRSAVAIYLDRLQCGVNDEHIR